MWGISGDIGMQGQQFADDELKKQLVQQQIQERIRQFEAEQGSKQRQFDAQQGLQRELLAQRQSEANDEKAFRGQQLESQDRNRRDRNNSEQLEVMGADRARMDVEDKRGRVGNLVKMLPESIGKRAAGLAAEGVNVAAPSLETSEERASRESASIAAEDAQWKRHADYSEGQLRSRPHRDPVPIVIQTPQGPQVLDRETREAKPITSSGNDVPLVPTTEQRNRQAARGTASGLLSSVAELSEKINVNQGVYAKAVGEIEKQKARVNLDDDVAEYEAMVQAFTPLWARALGHSGVLTQQDVDSARMALPRPGDSKTLRDRKLARIDTILGANAGAGGAQPAKPDTPKKPRFTLVP